MAAGLTAPDPFSAPSLLVLKDPFVWQFEPNKNAKYLCWRWTAAWLKRVQYLGWCHWQSVSSNKMIALTAGLHDFVSDYSTFVIQINILVVCLCPKMVVDFKHLTPQQSLIAISSYLASGPKGVCAEIGSFLCSASLVRSWDRAWIWLSAVVSTWCRGIFLVVHGENMRKYEKIAKNRLNQLKWFQHNVHAACLTNLSFFRTFSEPIMMHSLFVEWIRQHPQFCVGRPIAERGLVENHPQ